MFKKLRERIAEEANKLPPVPQISFGNNSQKPPDSSSRVAENSEDDIMPSDGSSIIEPHTVSQQFSIAEDEDASMSEPSTPQKRRTESTSSEKFLDASKQTPNSVGNNQASKHPTYVPQTDIESGVEEPPTLNLDGISKEQLLTTIQLLKARIYKYRNKYGEIVKAYKFLNEEKNKFECALTDNQDKSLRRIAELREQCQLEQKAKAHLEENLRLILEEKDSRISVLETQINLLKEGHSENANSNTSDDNGGDRAYTQSSVDDNSAIQQSLKEKLQTEHEEIVTCLKKRLTELQQQQEDMIMSMAETKKNMHEELELKERQLNKTKDELRQITNALDQERSACKTLEKQKEDEQKELQNRYDNLEKTMDEEKENLLRDFSRGKAEAITLIQEESAKQSHALEEEWRSKIQNLQTESEKTLKKKDEELQEKVKELLIIKEQLEDNLVNFKLLEEEKEQVSRTLEDLKIKQSLAPEPAAVEEDLVVFKDVFKTGNENSGDKKETRSFQELQKSQDLTEEIERLQENVKKLEQENEDLKKKDKTLKEKVNKNIKRFKEKYENQFKETEDRNAELRAKLKESCECQVKDLKLQVEELQKLNEELKTKYVAEHKTSEHRLKELQVENKKLKEQRDGQVATLETRLTQHLKESENLISKYDDKIKLLESRFSSLTEENDNGKITHENEVKDLELRVSELQESNLNIVSQHEERLNKLKSSIPKLEKQKVELTEKYEGKIKALDLHIEELSLQNSQLKEGIALQKDEKAALKSKYEEEIKARESCVPDLEKQRLFLEAKYEDEIKTLKSNVVELQESNFNSKRDNGNKTKEFEERISTFDLENVRLKSEYDELKQFFEATIEESENNNSKLILGYEDKIQDLESHLSQLNEQNSKLQNQIAEQSHEISVLNAKISVLVKDAEALNLGYQDQIKTSKLYVTELEDGKSVLNNQVEELTSQISELQKNNAELNDEMKALESRIPEMQNELCTLKKEYEEKIRTFENEVTQLQNENEQCSRRIHNFETDTANLTLKYDSLLKSSESHANELLKQISLTKEETKREIISLKDEFKLKLDEHESEGEKALEVKVLEIEKLQMELDACAMELAKHKSKSEEESKSSKILLTQLRNELSVSLSKIEEFNQKTQHLEKEREQLMIKAQERVAATEAKHREDIELLHQKIHNLQLQNKEIAKLKNENSVLNGQLDESLMVAAANQAEAEVEISSMNKKSEQLRDELSSIKKLHSDKEAEMKSTISTLQQEIDNLEILKKEKKELCATVKALEEKCSIQKELDLNNKRLKDELDSLKSVKAEKDELNSIIQDLRINEEQLCETVKVLRNEMDLLRTQCNCEVCECGEIKNLKSENQTMSEKIKGFQSQNFSSCPTCDQLKEDVSRLRIECDEMLKVKEDELNQKMKLIMKEYSTQINMKDNNCDEALSEVIEKSRDVEEQLERDHRLEIAALRQDIFERDCALEEMREHYESTIKEKDSRLCLNEEKNSPMKAVSTDSEFMVCNESSDWDDTWVVPEENCDNLSPGHDGKSVHDNCDEHVQRIESMQKELAKCNSELKDLRILLRLSPPPSLHSNNNNFNSSTHVPEPTEYEYLRNILFEYMMGKETVTLVKVIAAVLRFDEEQTQLIVEREKAKQPAR